MKTSSIGLLLLVCCCTSSTKENKDIAQFRNELPKLETPLEYNSDRRYKFKAIELAGNDIVKRLSEKNYFTLLGKVFETKNTITILGYIPDDIGTPVLITYGSNGSQLSSHPLYENATGDMGIYRTNVVTIQSDRQILFTDSTTTRKINAEGTDEIPGTDSVSVTHKMYRITDEGKVERIK